MQVVLPSLKLCLLLKILIFKRIRKYILNSMRYMYMYIASLWFISVENAEKTQ